jgi:maleylacetate reductase
MKEFIYTMRPARVVFGSGTIRSVAEEASRLGMKRALVLATPQQESEAQTVSSLLGPLSIGIFAGARMHTPVEVTAAAMERVDRDRADGVVAIGGGSTTGLGKAIAVRTDLPQLVIPTTYAGSEMTPILGETENGKKVTRTDPRILPESVIYDVDFTLGLPVPIAVTSGMNAVAHAVEALYAKDANPITSLMAETAIRSMARALPLIVANPADRDARSDALYAAWLSGMCLGAVGMALHHKLCHTLGGLFDLPHAEMHAALLPHALAYNAAAVPEAIARICRALDSNDAPEALFNLPKRLGAEMRLGALGLPEDKIEQAVAAAMSNPYWNPRPLERNALAALLRRAFAGKKPIAAQ